MVPCIGTSGRGSTRGESAVEDVIHVRVMIVAMNKTRSPPFYLFIQIHADRPLIPCRFFSNKSLTPVFVFYFIFPALILFSKCRIHKRLRMG